MKTLSREYIYSSHFGYIEAIRLVATATVSHIHAEPPTGLHEAQVDWMVDLSNCARLKSSQVGIHMAPPESVVWQLVRVSFPTPWKFSLHFDRTNNHLGNISVST